MSIVQRVSAELIEFSDSINPSEGYISKGTELVEDVYTKLKGVHNSGTLSRFKVDRESYGGSVGKKTSVIYPDFDCVVFLNNVKPPLTTFLKEFEIILRENAEELSIIPDSIKVKWLTVTATFKNGVEMDLLAACNFSQDPDEQHRLVLQHIRNENEPDNRMLYSSSLARLQLHFLRSQSSFTHQLIRLAKYWYKSLSLHKVVYGGSAMMEILCVAVIAESHPKVLMLEAFKRFLYKVAEMDTLKIAFIQVTVLREGKYVKEWKLINEWDIRDYSNHFDSNIISGFNYIIEPANPYNDMAQNISAENFFKLKIFAAEMLQRVEQLEDTRTNEMITVDDRKLTSIDISKLFEPFPLRLTDEYLPGILPTEVLVDYQYTEYNHNSAEPQLIKNSLTFDDDKELVTKVILNNLAFLIRAPKKKEVGDKTYVSYTDGVPHVGLDDVKEAVRRLTSANFNPDCIEESSFDHDHDGCDVTIYAPYYYDTSIFGLFRIPIKCAVRLSLKWSSGDLCVVM